jgi:hypothetical protein
MNRSVSFLLEDINLNLLIFLCQADKGPDKAEVIYSDEEDDDEEDRERALANQQRLSKKKKRQLAVRLTLVGLFMLQA